MITSQSFGEDKIIRYPGLTIDPVRREIVAKGKVLLDRGLIELLITSVGGKEHESILRMEARPHLLQAALILIGLEPGRGVRFSGDRQPPLGSRVEILVRWKIGEKHRSVRAEELIWNKQSSQVMPKVGWIFTGSRFSVDPASGREIFLASKTGAVAVTYHDPTAILDTPLSSGTDDTLFYANPDLCPPPGTSVEIVFRPLTTPKSGQGR